MDLVVPTYGRASLPLQTTLRQINEAGMPCTVVVQAREQHLWKREYWEGHLPNPLLWRVVTLPEAIRTIAPTRQWIVENLGEDKALVMVDDDLVFYKRRDDDPEKLRDISPVELRHAFFQLEKELLSGAAHAGFAPREGANRCTAKFMSNTRIMRVLGYRRDVLLKECIAFGRLQVMEDFDVALRLLRAGYHNIILNDYAHNQAGSGKEGGCSHFRTKELHAACAERLAELHPGFVRVVEKTTKGAWGGGTRKDVFIQWKKAYDASNR